MGNDAVVTPLLQWTDKYRVGIDAVDHEHRELIDLINRLHRELAAQDAETTVPAFLGDLLRAISAHFALEETFMRDRNYDQLAIHKEEHERLLDEIREMMEEFENSDTIDSGNLANRLDAWFSGHFKTHDARLHSRLGMHPHN